MLCNDEEKTIGRPLKFTLEDLQERINSYFSYCGIDMYGYPLEKEHKTPTITGLSCYLGTTRDLLLDYEKKKEFSDTIKRAKQIIQSYNEAMLFSRSASTAGIIFNLKNNYGWTDKAEAKSPFPDDFVPVQIRLPDNGR